MQPARGMTENARHLLLVEDEAPLREAWAAQLSDAGFDVVEAGSGEDAIDRLSTFAFDVVVTDLRLPGIDGVRVLEAARERYPEILVIVVTGYGTVRDAVETIKRGAADFITKPFQFDALLHVLRGALERHRLRAENAYLRSQLDERYGFTGLVGRSRPMRDLVRLLETVAPTSSTILIQGETGTGKSSSPGRFTIIRRGVSTVSWRSTAARFPKRCSKRSCSGTCAVRSRAPSATGRGVSSRRTAARCSSTRSGR
jgi:DNA-binding NtrC family response regulator